MSRRVRETLARLPIKAVYTIGELARAASMDPRAMRTLLEAAGGRFFRPGRGWLVSLAELELKVRPLWDGIHAAESLRRAMEHL